MATWAAPQQVGFESPFAHSENPFADSSRRSRHGSSGRTSNSSLVALSLENDLIRVDLPGSIPSDLDSWREIDNFSNSPHSNLGSEHDFLHIDTSSQEAKSSFGDSFTMTSGLPIPHVPATASQDSNFIFDTPGFALPNESSYWMGQSGGTLFFREQQQSHRRPRRGTNSTSAGEPWSPEASDSRTQNLGPDAHLMGPNSEHQYATSHRSGNSIGSSPIMFSFQPTPSPVRSPLFAQVEPATLMRDRQLSTTSSRSGISPTDQTPRLPHSTFDLSAHTADDTKPTFNFEFATPYGANEPTSFYGQSPIDSEYVHVGSLSSHSSSKSGKRKADYMDDRSSSQPFIVNTFAIGGSDTMLSSAEQERKKKLSRAGGRAIGSHLNAKTAARARDLRTGEGSCWICCLQRDSCSPGEVCNRCIKRHGRSNMDHGFSLGCDRTKLVDLKVIFIPDCINRTHEHATLSAFGQKHIKAWSSSVINIKLSCIWHLPPIELEVYEFEPRTPELLRQQQWYYDDETRKNVKVERVSPPLAMLQVEKADRQKYERYLSMIVEKYIDEFAQICYDDQTDDFMSQLLQLLVGYKPTRPDEASLLNDIYKLIVLCYLMNRTATIPKDQYHLLYQLRSYNAQTVDYGENCSPRMANRQLKFLFCSIFNTVMDSVLKRLQQILRSSKYGAKWTSAFCCLLALAMVFEHVQETTHLLCANEATMKMCTSQDAECRGDEACRAIDDKFHFLNNLFRWKYHKGFNPLKDWKDPKVQKDLDTSALDFAKSVSALVTQKYDIFLMERQYTSVSHHATEGYCGRLVSRFLVSFFPPSTD